MLTLVAPPDAWHRNQPSRRLWTQWEGVLGNLREGGVLGSLREGGRESGRREQFAQLHEQAEIIGCGILLLHEGLLPVELAPADGQPDLGRCVDG